MSEPIFIHRYTLHSRRGLNSRSDDTSHEGILIRINGGYGCIQPWEVLGDPSLEEVIDDLRHRRLLRPLVQQAVECTKIDGAARREGVSLFDEVNVPRSHATIVGGRDKVEAAIAAGFDVIKMKAGRDANAEVALINSVHADHPDLRWRLDFNNSLSGGEVENYIEGLCAGVREQIDFLEDPCRIDDPAWLEVRKVYGIPLAVDREIPEATSAFRYGVLKPAADDVETICLRALREAWKVVVTSYMDHPLGQCYAAWCAGNIDKRFTAILDPVAGLQTHGLFEPTAFTERLGAPSPEWQSPGGTGLGFDDLLRDLQWEELV